MTTSWSAAGRVLLVGASAALSVAACGGGGGGGAGNPIENPVGPVNSSTNSGAGASSGSNASGGDCRTGCAIGDDGMAFRVLSTRRFADAQGRSLVAFTVSLTNTSSQGHDFEPTDGTYPILASGKRLGGLDDPLIDAADSGDPRCYTDPIIHQTGDAQGYHVNPGATLRLPKEMCFAVPTTDKMVQVDLIDQDANADAEVHLASPV